MLNQYKINPREKSKKVFCQFEKLNQLSEGSPANQTWCKGNNATASCRATNH